ncbi:hypothetical protein ACMZ5F_15020 [Streptomyces rhizosphaericola]|uniref:hypothetical protein n=1 Tax=Streptomyces rhizosphaericola TaxID=2564098 RepID=UPI0039EE6CA3
MRSHPSDLETSMRVRTALITTALAATALLGSAGLAAAADPEPTNPLGLSNDVPLDFENNAVGTPFGQWDAPDFHEHVSGS